MKLSTILASAKLLRRREPYYTGAYQISSEDSPLHTNNGGTLTSAEIDQQMLEAAFGQKGIDYDVGDQSCIDVCSDALSAGGFDPGFNNVPAGAMNLRVRDRYYTDGNGETGYVDRRPIGRYPDIMANNPGSEMSTEVSPEAKERFQREFSRTKAQATGKLLQLIGASGSINSVPARGSSSEP